MESPGTSLSFDSNGKLLAVYSYEESMIKIFNIGNSGFIGSIFGLGSNSVTSIPVHRGSFDCETLKNEFKIALSWSENDKQLILKFGDSTQMNYDILR